MGLPLSITAGDTLVFNTSAGSDSSGNAVTAAAYTLSTSIRGSGGSIDAAGTANGSDWQTTIAGTSTANLAPGQYQWASYASKTGVRVTLETGTLTVLANLATATSFEARSHARRMLDAIEAMLERRATKEQQEYTIGNRSLKFIPLPEILQLRTAYRGEVAREANAERIARGLPTQNKVLVRLLPRG
jgi:hypothetical protein